MNQFLEGFLLQASLILALGAQNIFVLESALYKRRHLLAAFICTLCDAVLIAVGVAGAASVFVQFPLLKICFGILGVGFLLYYGICKIIISFKINKDLTRNPSDKLTFSAKSSVSSRQVVLLSLAFSLLNPHVYLDTVILIGGYSAKFPEMTPRFQFGTGAAGFSALWFFGLAVFASSFSKFLSSPRAMRAISLMSGVILIGLSWKLGCDIYSWL